MLRLNHAVREKKRSAVSLSDASAPVKAMNTLMNTMETWVQQTPPVKQSARFGNTAFRTWHSLLVSNAITEMRKVIMEKPDCSYIAGGQATLDELSEELAAYLSTSFGNETRIDYGSGHEAHFLVLLYCLDKVGVFEESDDETIVLIVFPSYLRVTRLLQTRYMLEPAGSHGVWGLDDYSFLPFLWGSSQLLSSTRVPPTFISDDNTIAANRNDYLYVDAIAYVKELKTGPFHEHSPTLHSISGVPGGWTKINQGMIKMYKGEVWAKKPVIQHFLFGDVFQFPNRKTASIS